MNYRTRWTLGYLGAGLGFACLFAVACIALLVAPSLATDPVAFTMLAWWTLGLFVVGAVFGIAGAIWWPTQWERQHAVRAAQRPVGALKSLIRRITPGRTR